MDVWATTTEGVFPYNQETDENFPLIGSYWFVNNENMGRVLKLSTTK